MATTGQKLKQNSGRILITFLLAATSIVSTIVDWNSSHIYNPEWHPHAVFHDVLLLIFLAGVVVIAIWGVWARVTTGQPQQRETTMKIATAIPIIFWGPFWFITLIVPTASLSAEGGPPTVNALGLHTYINQDLGLVIILLSLLGYWLYHKYDPVRQQQVTA